MGATEKREILQTASLFGEDMPQENFEYSSLEYRAFQIALEEVYHEF